MSSVNIKILFLTALALSILVFVFHNFQNKSYDQEELYVVVFFLSVLKKYRKVK